ncbi:MAG: hypothetical protein RL141_359 [Candidatus Parcubacteria bacterium]
MKSRISFEEKFAATAAKIIGVCNAILLPEGQEILLDRLLAGDLGGLDSYLVGLVLPALKSDNEELQQYACTAANLAVFQAVMIETLPRAIVAQLMTDSKTAFVAGKSKEMICRLAADAFSIQMARQLYAAPSDGRLFFLVPEKRQQVMLQSLVAIAHLLHDRRNESRFYWQRVQVLAELRQWEEIAGSMGMPDIRALSDGLETVHLKEAHTFLCYVRQDNSLHAADVDLSTMGFSFQQVPDETLVRSVAPDSPKRVAGGGRGSRLN